MNLLAIDPGKATGILEIRNDTFFKSYTLNHAELNKSLAYGYWAHYNIWVIESFSIYPWKSRALAFSECLPAQIIGAIKLYSYQQDINLTFQNAGLVKGSLTNEQLKDMKIPWLKKLKNQHERDAAKHAIYYLIKNERGIK